MIDPVMIATLRLGLALLLLSSAWHKMRSFAAFRDAVAGYAVLPQATVPVMASFAVATESMLAVGLMLPTFGAHAALGCVALFAIYTGAIILNLARGRIRIDCGCAGPAGALPLSWALVGRNGVLLAAALFAASTSAARTIGVADMFLVAAATTTFALLYAAAETAVANATRWRTWSLLQPRSSVSA